MGLIRPGQLGNSQGKASGVSRNCAGWINSGVREVGSGDFQFGGGFRSEGLAGAGDLAGAEDIAGEEDIAGRGDNSFGGGLTFKRLLYD